MAQNYSLLSPLPDGQTSVPIVSDPATVIDMIAYSMTAFIIVAGLAFFIYGIILRMKGGPNSIQQSKGEFKRVFISLGFAFTVVSLLLFVNPAFGQITFRKSTGDIASTQPSSNLNTPTTGKIDTPFIPKNNDDPAGWAAIQNDPPVRAALRGLPNGGITVNKDRCITPVQTSCTTVGGWPESTLNMLAQLRSTCSGRIEITGGTENGHKSHGPGLTPVDISLNDGTLENCIRAFPQVASQSFCKKSYSKFGFTFCDEFSNVSHWHVYQ